MTTIIDERRELWNRLAPIMGEDSDLAAGILIMALRREFGYPIKEEDQPRFQAAFDRLPRGSTVKPQPLPVSSYSGNTGPYWSVIFIESGSQHRSSKRFDTKADAEAYADDFLLRLEEACLAGP